MKKLLAAIAVCTGVVLAAVALPSVPANAAVITHGALVPESPALGYPVIRFTPVISSTSRRQVKATDQVGRVIVSGGNFVEVERQDGTVVPSQYFAAWNIDTKQLVCPGAFSFNGEVLAVEPGPTPTTVYVGGRFAKATGGNGIEISRNKVALLRLDTCSIDPTFNSTGGNAKVNDIVRVGNRLFLGGDFTAIGGQPIETLAELNATTGAINPSFVFTSTDELADRVNGLAANDAGTRLYVGGRFGTLTRNGVSIPAPTAVVDISNPANAVLTNHRSSGYPPVSDLQDVGVSPDGSGIALVYGTATSSDYVYMTNTTESPVSPRWNHFMRDSGFGIAVSDTAVYVAGHFCKPDSGPGPSDVMSPKMGFNECTGTTRYSGGVWRSHLAALRVSDGTPMTWNPGQASFTGGRALTVTKRGLLVGFDGDRTDDIRTGSLAFFDFGPSVEDPTGPSDVTFTAPGAGASVGTPAVISGSATDDVAVVSFRLSLQFQDGRYARADGSLTTTFTELTVPAALDGTFSTSIPLAAGGWTARAVAVDPMGRRSTNTTVRTFTETGLEAVPPKTVLTVPTAPVPTETNVSVSGTTTDNAAVASLRLRVTNSVGKYLQLNGTLGTNPADLPTTVTGGALGTGSVTWSASLGTALPVGTFTVEMRATDTAGNAGTDTASFSVTSVITTPSPAVTGYSGFSTSRTAATVGSIFTVDQPTKIGALGIQDVNGNGVLDNPSDAPIAIWNQSTKAFVVQTTVRRDAPSEGGWFYGTLITPVVLEAGITYVVGYQTFSNGESYASGGTLSTDPDVFYSGRASVSSSSFTYPTGQSSSVGYGVPNMRILNEQTAAPVPIITSPANDITFGQPAVLSVTATDNTAITTLRMELTNAAGQYYQPNGTWSTLKANVSSTVTGLGTPSATATFFAPGLPLGTYTVRAYAVDAAQTLRTDIRTFSVTTTVTSQTGFTNYSNYSTSSSFLTTMLGTLFQVSNPTNLTALGMFDADGDGNVDGSSDVPIALWRQSDRALLAQTTILRGTASENRWFYRTLASAVTLQPGTTYVIAYQSRSGGERYASGGTITPAPGVTVLGRAYTYSSSVSYPSSQSSSVGYGIPNFKSFSPTPPTVLAIGDRSDPTLTSTTLQISALDSDGGTVTYAAAGLPGGMTLDTNNGLVTGTPTTVGAYPVTVTVTDDEGQTAQTSFTWTITDGTPVPPCTAEANPGGGVLLKWVLVPGIVTYNVRTGNTWLATVNNVSSYAMPNQSLATPFTIRHRVGVTTVDRDCTVI